MVGVINHWKKLTKSCAFSIPHLFFKSILCVVSIFKDDFSEALRAVLFQGSGLVGSTIHRGSLKQSRGLWKSQLPGFKH